MLIITIIIGMFVIIAAIPAVLAFIVLSRVPPLHRKQKPGLAFLLLIPFFSLVWAFFVHPKVAESIKGYYLAQGDSTVGDCGASLALWFCICSACAFIPFLGKIAGVAALVLMIIFYVKAFGLSSRISQIA